MVGASGRNRTGTPGEGAGF